MAPHVVVATSGELLRRLLDLGIGVGASAVWVMILFAVKPRVAIKLVGADGTYTGFDVENLGLARAVQVEARVWYVRVGGRLDDRQQVMLRKGGDLLTLNGKWRESRPSAWEHTHKIGNSKFRFLFREPICASTTATNDRYLIQIACNHSFSNFGRVHIFRIAYRDPDPTGKRIPEFAIVEQRPGRTKPWPSTRLIAWLFRNQRARR
jgi:hypothetical protein